jgi:hypothetical protein
MNETQHPFNSASPGESRITNLLCTVPLPSTGSIPMRPRHPRASTSTVVRCASAALWVAAATSCANPKAQAAIAQELNDAASEINAVKGDIAQLQSDVDSLRQVIAKQDTVISRLVEVTHVPR